VARCADGTRSLAHRKRGNAAHSKGWRHWRTIRKKGEAFGVRGIPALFALTDTINRTRQGLPFATFVAFA